MPTPKPTRRQAAAALAAIRTQFGVTNAEITAGLGPQLVQDFESMSGSTAPYAIVWEGGPYEWTYDAFERSVGEFGHKIEGVTRPAGIFPEPINHYALGLYRDDSMPEHTPMTWAEADAVAAKLEAERIDREAEEIEQAAAAPSALPVLKGMRANIYRRASDYDTSNGGISSRCQHVTVVGPNVPQLSEPTADAPAVELGETTPGYIVARPVDAAAGAGWMAGGTFVHILDSRFPIKHPVPLHDRDETWAQYEALSR